MDRPRDFDVARDAYDGAVLRERGVERGERVRLMARHRAQSVGDVARSPRGREVAHLDAGGQLLEVRQLGREAAVHERDRVPVAGAEIERREVVTAHVARSRREQREFLVGDRRDARVVPVLVLRRREAERGEAVERGPTECAARRRERPGRRRPRRTPPRTRQRP